MRVELDNSGLVKRGLREGESVALAGALCAFETAGDALFSSFLAWIEVSRAIRFQLGEEPPSHVAELVEIALSGID